MMTRGFLFPLVHGIGCVIYCGDALAFYIIFLQVYSKVKFLMCLCQIKSLIKKVFFTGDQFFLSLTNISYIVIYAFPKGWPTFESYEVRLLTGIFFLHRNLKYYAYSCCTKVFTIFTRLLERKKKQRQTYTEEKTNVNLM